LGIQLHGYLSEVESGKKMPSVEFVLRVSRLFNVTTDELLKDELELDLSKGGNHEARRPLEYHAGESDTSSRISNTNSRSTQD
jgi:transcriptional regulator with XRE-family HTH domain